MKRLPRIVQLLVIGCVMMAPYGPALAAMERTPMELVKSAIAEVLHILAQEELRQPDRTAERRQEIERVVRDRVSYEEMAKRSLGQRWNDLSAAEQQEFVGLFVQLLRDQFAGKIDVYTNEQIQYLSEQRDAHLAEVRTVLTGAKTETHLDFRLADRTGDWLVYDVVIDGASVVSNYRAQFASLMRDHGYEGLVERMKEKTLVVKAFERPSKRED
jgi:phospholipid transport system substrate-binding protein